jgi:RND family efflux transporter MFP subunit
MLAYARVVAPFDGIVTYKLADVGDLAAPGKPLFEVADPKELRAEADVPESLIGRVQIGNKLQVRFSTLELLLEGAVSEVAPVADANSRTFLVKMDLPAEPQLRAGMFGRVLVPAGERASLSIPAGSVTRRGQLELVYVVEEDLARLRLVKTGKWSGDKVEIVSGLEGGEMVITSASGTLVDGQPVNSTP